MVATMIDFFLFKYFLATKKVVVVVYIIQASQKRKNKVAYIMFGFDFLFSSRWKKILHFFYSNMKDHIEAFIALVSTFRANIF